MIMRIVPIFAVMLQLAFLGGGMPHKDRFKRHSYVYAEGSLWKLPYFVNENHVDSRKRKQYREIVLSDWSDSEFVQVQYCYSGVVTEYRYPKKPHWPVSRHIVFYPPFKKTPAIMYGMLHLDTAKDTNIRAKVSHHSLSRHGFVIQLTSWDDTKQWGLGVRWMACPAA